MDEHRAIERVLAALDILVAKALTGDSPDPVFFESAADFARSFADRAHHAKEENLLFRAMQDNGFPVDEGPIGCMLREHDFGRSLSGQMRDTAKAMRSGDGTSRTQMLASAAGYSRLLGAHIQKEDQVLYPLAEQVIPESDRAALLARFLELDVAAKKTVAQAAEELMQAFAPTVGTIPLATR
jgi:hemerythrin-like domain-containing protein